MDERIKRAYENLLALRAQTAEIFAAGLVERGICRAGDEVILAAKQAYIDNPSRAEMFFLGRTELVSADNPYGCNQYGEGWKIPHNGKSTAYQNTGFGGQRRKMLTSQDGGNRVTVRTDDKRPGKDAYPAADKDSLDKQAQQERKRRTTQVNSRELNKVHDSSKLNTGSLTDRLNAIKDMINQITAWTNRASTVKAAAGTQDNKRPIPVKMPDGTECHTIGCVRHEGADKYALEQAQEFLDELVGDMNVAVQSGDPDAYLAAAKRYAEVAEYAIRLKDIVEKEEAKKAAAKSKPAAKAKMTKAEREAEKAKRKAEKEKREAEKAKLKAEREKKAKLKKAWQDAEGEVIAKQKEVKEQLKLWNILPPQAASMMHEVIVKAEAARRAYLGDEEYFKVKPEDVIPQKLLNQYKDHPSGLTDEANKEVAEEIGKREAIMQIDYALLVGYNENGMHHTGFLEDDNERILNFCEANRYRRSYFDMRQRSEAKLEGTVNGNLDGRRHPLCALLERSLGGAIKLRNNSSYGNVFLKFKPEVRERTTFTGVNSLGANAQGVKDSSLITNPTQGNPWTHGQRAALNRGEKLNDIIHKSERYLEAQIRGNIHPAHIEAIGVPKRLNAPRRTWGDAQQLSDTETARVLAEKLGKVTGRKTKVVDAGNHWLVTFE